MENYSAEINIDIMKSVRKWIELGENIMSEVTETWKDKDGVYSFRSREKI